MFTSNLLVVGHAGALPGGLGVQQLEHHLEQRIPAQVPLRMQLFNQGFEWQILVRVGIERRAVHLPKELSERHRARQARPEHQRVHEKADQRFELGSIAPGDRRADSDVALSRVAIEQHLERREQGHEQRDAMLSADFLERRVHPVRAREWQELAAKGLDRAARTISRQVQDREVGELPAPGPEPVFPWSGPRASSAARPQSRRTESADPGAATGAPRQTR